MGWDDDDDDDDDDVFILFCLFLQEIEGEEEYDGNYKITWS